VCVSTELLSAQQRCKFSFSLQLISSKLYRNEPIERLENKKENNEVMLNLLNQNIP
jgi:hypothetical protein